LTWYFTARKSGLLEANWQLDDMIWYWILLDVTFIDSNRFKRNKLHGISHGISPWASDFFYDLRPWRCNRPVRDSVWADLNGPWVVGFMREIPQNMTPKKGKHMSGRFIMIHLVRYFSICLRTAIDVKSSTFLSMLNLLNKPVERQDFRKLPTGFLNTKNAATCSAKLSVPQRRCDLVSVWNPHVEDRRCSYSWVFSVNPYVQSLHISTILLVLPCWFNPICCWSIIPFFRWSNPMPYCFLKSSQILIPVASPWSLSWIPIFVAVYRLFRGFLK
jgi:hypothetical protein